LNLIFFISLVTHDFLLYYFEHIEFGLSKRFPFELDLSNIKSQFLVPINFKAYKKFERLLKNKEESLY
jgi:hypothetical protein